MVVDIKKIIDLRHKLHRMAELSGKEFKTSEEIYKFIKKFKPNEVIKLADTGLAFVFDSGKPGKTVMFRAELDALPIHEPENFHNRSMNDNVSHKCGHDGHMSILAGFAETIFHDKPQKGKVVLLFQPAEESLQGAKIVIDDPNFKKIEPDYIFALHNLPGFPQNSIIIRKGNFTSATNGVTINLHGNTSHAANPEKATNPTEAIINLLNFFRNKIISENSFENFALATPIFARIGTPDFGITPGHADLKITLRSYEYSDLDKLTEILKNEVEKTAKIHKLKFDISFTDDAAPIKNFDEPTQIVIDTAKENSYFIVNRNEPFKWTDDFGFFTLKYNSVYFGFGSGNIPDLHDKNYMYPDNSLLPAIKLFYNIYKKTNK